MSGYICTECGHHCEMPMSSLVTYNGRTHAMNICPECAEINSTLRMCCQEPGCQEEVGCGTPTRDGGYKHHCHRHPPDRPETQQPIG